MAIESTEVARTTQRQAGLIGVIPPKGPPQNLRPAGTHKNPKRDKTRAEQLKEALKEQIEPES